MKLAKRISIALLAACVVGGSAFAMTACGGGSTPDPTPSSDPTPVVSQEVSEPDDDVIVSTPEAVTDDSNYARKVYTGSEGISSFTTSASLNLVYLDGYDTVNFKAAFNDLIFESKTARRSDSNGVDGYMDGWAYFESLYGIANDLVPDKSVLEENERDVFVVNDYEGAYIVAFMGFCQQDFSAHVYKLVILDQDSNHTEVYEGEDAHNKMIEMMKEVVE